MMGYNFILFFCCINYFFDCQRYKKIVFNLVFLIKMTNKFKILEHKNKI